MDVAADVVRRDPITGLPRAAVIMVPFNRGFGEPLNRLVASEFALAFASVQCGFGEPSRAPMAWLPFDRCVRRVVLARRAP